MGPAAGQAVLGTRATGGAMSAFAATVLLVSVFTALRVLALFLTPLELYPDEAQYWAWAQVPALGYFSKPPLVAWLIGITTWVGGNSEPFVRLAAPLAHAGAALALQRAGARLYDGRTGFWAAALYMLMPGVQLSAGVIATDAPLFLFLALALWAYAAMLKAPDPGARVMAAAALGAALGLAWLSKYAAIYFVAGLVLHALVSREARAAWGRRALAAAAAIFLAAAAPNAVWNLGHGFATLGHTIANAGWGPPLPNPGRPDGPDVYDFRDAPGFLLVQFGVFGPIPFAALIVGAVLMARRRALEAPDRLLLCFVIPPLAIVLVQAAMSRANANWGAAGYGAASVLVAAWLLRWEAWRLAGAAFGTQAGIALLFLAAAVSPAFADGIGLANSFKHARGWRATTEAVLDRARSEGADAIAVDDRFLFNAMTYYGREALAQPGAPRLVMWMRRPRAYVQAEVSAPLTETSGARVLGASLERVYLGEMEGDFSHVTPAGEADIRLDPRRDRTVAFFVGEGFRRAPRDERTGLPLRSGPPVAPFS